MKRLVVGVVAGVLLASSLVATTPDRSEAASSGKIARDVRAILETLGPDGLTTVIVDVRDPSGSAALHPDRNAIRALRSAATSSQRALRATLRAARADGSVASFTPLWVTNAISVTATADVVYGLAIRPDVASITSDQVEIVLSAAPAESNIAAVQAPTLWGQGISGEGVVVATLDSGVDMSHPDLASSWRGGPADWFDPYGQHPTTPTDLSGHGSATMGVILGTDTGGTSIGVAPGAIWIAAKIFNDSGSATATAVHQAFQWVLDPDGDPSTDDAPSVVNGSWSIGTGPGCDLAFQPDVQALRAAGILPVFAAGNFGPGVSTSVSPANYAEAFAVGAVDDAGVLYPGSGQGPSACGGRARVYPDLVAPGVDVRTADRYGQFQTVSGTSVAAPHATGAAALLLSGHPGLTPDQLATSLQDGAADLGVAGPDDVTGAGLLDVASAENGLTLFADGFESGTFSAWSGATTNHGSLAVTGAAALEGNYGMAASIANAAGMFVTDRTPSDERSYRAAFSFDPNGALIPPGKGLDVFVGMHGWTRTLRLRIRSASGAYQLRAICRNDVGTMRYSSWFAVSDAPHVIEVAWSAAPGAGSMAVLVDGPERARLSGLSNGSMTLDTVRLGPQAIGAGISGTAYFDAFISTSGGPIG